METRPIYLSVFQKRKNKNANRYTVVLGRTRGVRRRVLEIFCQVSLLGVWSRRIGRRPNVIQSHKVQSARLPRQRRNTALERRGSFLQSTIDRVSIGYWKRRRERETPKHRGGPLSTQARGFQRRVLETWSDFCFSSRPHSVCVRIRFRNLPMWLEDGERCGFSQSRPSIFARRALAQNPRAKRTRRVPFKIQLKIPLAVAGTHTPESST